MPTTKVIAALVSSIGFRMVSTITNQKVTIRMNPRDPSIFFRFSGLALANYTSSTFGPTILWAERAIHRMLRRDLAHFLLAASHVALGRSKQARAAVEACHAVLPGFSVTDAERMPLQDAAKMQEFRDRLGAAGFAAKSQT